MSNYLHTKLDSICKRTFSILLLTIGLHSGAVYAEPSNNWKNLFKKCSISSAKEQVGKIANLPKGKAVVFSLCTLLTLPTIAKVIGPSINKAVSLDPKNAVAAAELPIAQDKLLALKNAQASTMDVQILQKEADGGTKTVVLIGERHVMDIKKKEAIRDFLVSFKDSHVGFGYEGVNQYNPFIEAFTDNIIVPIYAAFASGKKQAPSAIEDQLEIAWKSSNIYLYHLEDTAKLPISLKEEIGVGLYAADTIGRLFILPGVGVFLFTWAKSKKLKEFINNRPEFVNGLATIAITFGAMSAINDFVEPRESTWHYEGGYSWYFSPSRVSVLNLRNDRFVCNIIDALETEVDLTINTMGKNHVPGIAYTLIQDHGFNRVF